MHFSSKTRYFKNIRINYRFYLNKYMQIKFVDGIRNNEFVFISNTKFNAFERYTI